MAHYLSDSVMLDALKKVQDAQVEIIKKGYSAHLDTYVHEEWLDAGVYYITFELVVFKDRTISQTFEFSARDTEGIINATVARAEAYAKTL